MFKKRYLFFIIIVGFFVISTVSAEEISNETDSSLITQYADGNNVLNAAGSFSELQNLINKNDVVNLTKDYTATGEGSITITKDKTINGNGYTINGNGKTRIFEIKGGTVVFNNIVFTKGKTSDEGGAIYSKGTLKIINCNFKSNEAKVDGGAIYAKGNVNIRNTTFENNKASGATFSECYGGAIRSEGEVRIINCSFLNNYAEDYGGAIYANSVYVNSTSYFKGNKANDDDGGAIYADNSVKVEDTIISDSSSKVDGGAIYAKGNVNIKNTTFKNNKASGAKRFQCYGGAVMSKSVVYVDNCSFLNNYAEDYGGAIYANSVYITSASYFENNKNDDNDGGAIYADNSVTVVDSIFSGNSAYANGGAIYAKKNINIKNTTFKNNKALGASRAHGGAIYSEGDVSIDNCSFLNNYAKGCGGAIYTKTISWVDSPSYFIANHAAYYGGVILAEQFITDVKYCVFINNYADESGGVIYINNHKVKDFTISQCYFENNRAEIGGVIEVHCTDPPYTALTFDYNIFIDNWAKTGIIAFTKGDYDRIHNNWFGINNFNFDNVFVQKSSWSTTNCRDDKPVAVELSLNETACTGEPSTLIVTFLSDGELFNYDANFTADNGAIITNHKIGNNKVTSDIEFNEGITNITATVNHQVLTLSYSFYKENVTMNINAQEISFGDNATVNIIFTPNNATGTVSVGNISSDIVNGASSVIIPNLSVGNHTLPVIYSGDGIYNPNQANVTITVNRKNLNINASAKPVHQGDNATVIVNGLEYATGNVTVTIGSNKWMGKISNGTATINIQGLNENVCADVTYPGDANYTNASTTVSIVVNPHPKINLTISASADPIMLSENAIVIVTGLENATGNVTATIGDEKWYGEIIEGTATVIVTGLTENVTASVFYAGDYKYNNATTTVNITVNPAITVWYVNGSKASSGNGTTPDTAFKTLKEALNKAPENSTIYIAPGTYTGENNTNLTINKNLKFINYGVGEVIFDAQGLSRIWTVQATSINITGLTFKNGKEQSVCGAIFFNQTINNSYINAIFINNTAVEGIAGAIGFYAEVTNTNINAIFINNTALDDVGGAIGFYGDLINVNITGNYMANKAEDAGGAIFFYGDLSNVNIIGNYTANTAENYGGAISFYGDLSNVNITGNYTANSVDDYGGVFYFNRKLTDVNIFGYYNNNLANDTAGVFYFNGNLTNVIISGDYSNNMAQYGAVCYVNDPASINNSILSGNYNNNTAAYYAVLYLGNIVSNSIISGNYTNNNAETGINYIAAAENVSISGKYINNTVSYNGMIYIILNGANNSIHDSIFINNTIDDELIIVALYGPVLSVNNWFGNNATNYNIKPDVGENVNMTNWLFLNATANTTELKINQTAEITFKLYSYKDGEINEYDASKMNIILDLSQTLGELDKTTILIGDNVLYTAKQIGNAGVTAKFENASYTIDLRNKDESAINVVAENVTKYFNGTEQFIVNVTDETGKGISGQYVLITVNGINYNRTTDDDGSVYLDINLPSGNYTATVNVGNITVNSTIIVKTTVTGQDIISEFRNVTYLAWLVDSEGNALENGTAVEFNIDGIRYTAYVCGNEGQANLDLILNSGNYTITVTNPSTGEKHSNNITINAKNPSITVTAPPITVGENATVTITLPNDATGNITVGNETLDLNDGTACANLTNLPVGNTIVPVTYFGDNKYNNVSTTVTIIVNPAPEPGKKNLKISANAEPITVGDNATIIVTGLENATGNVTVIVNGKIYTASIGGGEAEVIVSGLTENVTASVNYAGDDKYNPASTTVNITVNPAPEPGKKNLTISASAEPITAGENATIIVTGLENATGNVTVTVNGKTYTAPISGGEAEVIVPGLTENVTASVNYAGDDKYNSASTTVNITVNPAPEPGKKNLTISASAEPITVGENATVIVTGLENATGNVTVIVNGKTYTASIKNSEAEVIVPGLTENVTASVNYAGDGTYNPASTTVNITVNRDVVIYAPDVTKYYGGSERFAVTLKDLNDNPIANADIKITINGQTYTKTTDSNGETSIGINLNSGVYNVTTEYNGTKVYSTVTVKDTVIAKDVTKIFRNATQYRGTFVDSKGNLVKNTDVRININGVFYTRTTDSNGMAQMNINLPPGTYILTATNPSTGEMHTTTITVLPNIVENYDLIKYYRNASQYSLRLLDDKGNPVGAGVSIQLNINGVFYTKTSDENGYVRMNINLPPGTYIVTAEYKGLKASNTIEVLPVLNASDVEMKYGDGTQFKVNLVDGRGNPYAKQVITFNINGVFYNRLTDSTGQAILNLNLPIGEYIITSSFNGANIANKITITG